MVVINFFNVRDSHSAGKLIADYFKLNSQEVIEELKPYKGEDYDLLQFIKKFKIDLERQYHKVTFITCRHATTTYDELKLLKDKGLLNLNKMLDEETPLSKFLFEHGITINVGGKTLMFNGIRYPLYKYDEVCGQCIFEAYECESIFTNKPNYKDCDYRRALYLLHSKLYHDKCEIEVFLDAEISDIYEYDSVRYSPEILNTIEQILAFYDAKKYNLQDMWRDIPNNKYYILEFDIPIEAFDYATTKSTYERYWDIEEIADHFGYTEWDFEDNTISTQFYLNLFLIKNLVNKFIWGKAKKYGQILPETIITCDSIRVIREHHIND